MDRVIDFSKRQLEQIYGVHKYFTGTTRDRYVTGAICGLSVAVSISLYLYDNKYSIEEYEHAIDELNRMVRYSNYAQYDQYMTVVNNLTERYGQSIIYKELSKNQKNILNVLDMLITLRYNQKVLSLAMEPLSVDQMSLMFTEPDHIEVKMLRVMEGLITNAHNFSEIPSSALVFNIERISMGPCTTVQLAISIAKVIISDSNVAILFGGNFCINAFHKLLLMLPDVEEVQYYLTQANRVMATQIYMNPSGMTSITQRYNFMCRVIPECRFLFKLYTFRVPKIGSVMVKVQNVIRHFKEYKLVYSFGIPYQALVIKRGWGTWRVVLLDSIFAELNQVGLPIFSSNNLILHHALFALKLSFNILSLYGIFRKEPSYIIAWVVNELITLTLTHGLSADNEFDELNLALFKSKVYKQYITRSNIVSNHFNNELKYYKPRQPTHTHLQKQLNQVNPNEFK